MAIAFLGRKGSLAEAEELAGGVKQQRERLFDQLASRRTVLAASEGDRTQARAERAAAAERTAELRAAREGLAAGLARRRSEASAAEALLASLARDVLESNRCSEELRERISRLTWTRAQLQAAQSKLAPVALTSKPSRSPLYGDDCGEDAHHGLALAALAGAAQAQEGESQEALRAELVALVAETVELGTERQALDLEEAKRRASLRALQEQHAALGERKAEAVAAIEEAEAANAGLRERVEAARERNAAARRELDQLQASSIRAGDDIVFQNKHMANLKQTLRREVTSLAPTLNMTKQQKQQADLAYAQRVGEIESAGAQRVARERERRAAAALAARLAEEPAQQQQQQQQSERGPLKAAPPAGRPQDAGAGPAAAADRSKGTSSRPASHASSLESESQQHRPLPLPILDMRMPDLRGAAASGSPPSARLAHAGRLVLG